MKFKATCSLTLLAFACGAVQANTIGYWRMEQDDNANQLSYSVPNEVTSGNPLTGAFGDIEAEVPFDTVPLTGAANSGALSGVDNTGFSPDISGSVSYYPALDASSITIEFFARTLENQGNFISRRDGASSGILINNPSELSVRYTTVSGLVELTDLFDFGADWEHFAFTYDQATGVGNVYVSGNLVGTHDGPDGEALTWPSGSALLVGQALAGGPALLRESIFDELRISDTALNTTEFLDPFVIPEPASLAAGAVGALLLLRRQRRI
ncbi:MAG: LamG-like jellyroll fold domain-containing protein [Planctomycetota bacterium]